MSANGDPFFSNDPLDSEHGMATLRKAADRWTGDDVGPGLAFGIVWASAGAAGALFIVAIVALIMHV